MNKWKPWTEGDYTKLISLYTVEKLTVLDIARVMERTKEAVKNKIKDLDLHRSRVLVSVPKPKPKPIRRVERTSPIPETPPPPEIRVQDGIGLGFMELKPDGCRQILGRDSSDQARFCAEKAMAGYSYCPHHKQLNILSDQDVVIEQDEEAMKAIAPLLEKRIW